jgi:DNA invertase Pin-like site-specific DNA recombinase
MLTISAGVATGGPEIVLEQQRDGIAELKAEGKYKGRTPTVAWQIDEIRAMHANGLGAAAIARQHICGLPARVYRTLGVLEVPEGS